MQIKINSNPGKILNKRFCQKSENVTPIFVKPLLIYKKYFTIKHDQIPNIYIKSYKEAMLQW